MPVDRKAYLEGEKAYWLDKPIHRNPYQEANWAEKQGWLDGWLDAQRDKELRSLTKATYELVVDAFGVKLDKPRERRIRR